MIIEKTFSYNIFKTSQHLLDIYAFLTTKIQESNYDIHTNEEVHNEKGYMKNVSVNLSLLILNASILEGALRQVYSASLSEEQKKIASIMIDSHNHIYNKTLLRLHAKIRKAQLDNEVSGGWDKLLSSIKEHFGLNVTSEMSDDKILNSLFAIRNSISHGTALVIPTSEDYEGVDYLIKWKSKLEAINNNCKSRFGCDFMDALKLPGFASVFMDETKLLLINLKKYKIFNNDQVSAFDTIINYKFGFMLHFS